MADRRKNLRKPLSLDKLRLSMSTAVRELERIYLNEGNTPEMKIRAINSLASLANSYSRITEVSDLEERIKSLEEVIKD